MAMYSTFRGRTIAKMRSMYSKMSAIISSSFFGAGLQPNQLQGTMAITVQQSNKNYHACLVN